MWGVGIIAPILSDKHTQMRKCGTHYICLRCGNYYIHAQMKVDASLRDDGMEYIHARKPRVVLICAHIMMQISVITIYVNGYFTNNSQTWRKFGVSLICSFWLSKYHQTFIAYIMRTSTPGYYTNNSHTSRKFGAFLICAFYTVKMTSNIPTLYLLHSINEITLLFFSTWPCSSAQIN